MQLQVELVLSDDLKNYYQEEKQPTGEKTPKLSSLKFLFELFVCFEVRTNLPFNLIVIPFLQRALIRCHCSISAYWVMRWCK